MGLQIRDERQMKALTGLSQAQFDSLLPVFSAIYRAAQQHTYAAGSQAGTRRRRPGGGSPGKLPTLGLFAIIEAESKSLHNRPISFFSGCVHFAIQRPDVESA